MDMHPPERSSPSATSIHARTVAGVFEGLPQAETAIQNLFDAGFPNRDLSLVLQSQASAPRRESSDTRSASGVVAGASAGALLGGVMGLTALVIPGVGPLIAAGPIAVMISSILAGGTAGSLLGSFVGLGIPNEQAQTYEAAVRGGGGV